MWSCMSHETADIMAFAISTATGLNALGDLSVDESGPANAEESRIGAPVTISALMTTHISVGYYSALHAK